MKRKAAILGASALLATAGIGALAWWLGMQQGIGRASAAQAAAAAPVDPSQWSIPQGEAATRRHIRDGLKGGDVDPVTGLRIQHYHDPMVPGKNFEAPAKSPFMDMMLVPRYAGSTSGGNDASGVTVNPRIQRNLGLRSAPVVEGSLALEVSAVGNVAWNERLQEVVSARAMGFVEKLHVRATLDRVSAGAPLVELYVPDWVAAQEEYLAVARMRGDGIGALLDAARARMRQAGMDAALIERVARDGQVQARVTFTAPIGGVVSKLLVREGATVMPGMPLLELQGTGTVWAEAQVPESQAAQLRPGTRASVTSPAVPGQVFEGRLQALLPEVDSATRTLKARLELANPGVRLVPGMFVQLRFASPARAKTLLVPSDAVIHTGRRSVVMLAEDDGRFRPIEVQTGLEAGGHTEIAAGLAAGQRVVLSGQFLIDSEASLRGLQAQLNPQPPAAGAATHTTGARITTIDGDTVTLDHPPIPLLQWPRMEMDFRLPPRAQRPHGLTPGEQVQLDFRMQDGDVPQITAIQRAAPGAAR